VTTYRLDRRFTLQAIGLTLLIAGIALAVSMMFDNTWVVTALWVFALLLVVRAGLLWFRPPPVARLTADQVTLGGPLTVRPVQIGWKDVQNVSLKDDGRLLLDRGGDTVVVFPLHFVGGRARELTRDIYDRLNEANGYRRFDPSADQ